MKISMICCLLISLVTFSAVLANTTVSGPYKLKDDMVHLVVGEVADIDVLLNDDLAGRDISEFGIRIVDKPKEGIVRVEQNKSTLRYRHGGSSLNQDQFSYELLRNGEVVSTTAEVVVTFREVQARVRITSPQPNAVIKGNQVVVEYVIQGSDFDHMHINLNGKHNTVKNLTGRYVLTDVEPGKHVISLNLSNSRHQVLRHPGAEESVILFVEP